jgi:hypothetical protein
MYEEKRNTAKGSMPYTSAIPRTSKPAVFIIVSVVWIEAGSESAAARTATPNKAKTITTVRINVLQYCGQCFGDTGWGKSAKRRAVIFHLPLLVIERSGVLESYEARQPGTVSRRQIDLFCRSFAHSPTHAIIQNGYRSVHFSQDKSKTKLPQVKTKMGNLSYFRPPVPELEPDCGKAWCCVM